MLNVLCAENRFQSLLLRSGRAGSFSAFLDYQNMSAGSFMKTIYARNVSVSETDLEYLADEYAIEERKADEHSFSACECAYKASLLGRDDWAVELARASKKTDDTARNRRNAWEVYLILLSVTEKAEDIKRSLYHSHFSVAYKHLKDGADHYLILDAFLEALDGAYPVRKFAAKLDAYFGDEPSDKYRRKMNKFSKDLIILHGMSEYNQVPQKVRRAMRLLIGRIKENGRLQE
jgi:hypothetical protein